MTSFQDYIAHGNAWLYIPAAILLGALHGLEPGHSKTMMAAFIIAIRGTVLQAVLLGVSATVSHTALIWVLAFVGLRYSGRFSAQDVEPYLQLATGAIVIALALWMVWRLRRNQSPATHGPHGGPLIKVEDGLIEISVFEHNVPPRFRIYFFDQARLAIAPPEDIEFTCRTIRGEGPNAVRQHFRFKNEGSYLEAVDELPEPHEFQLQATITRDGNARSYETRFVEEHDHAHGHGHHHHHDHADHHHDHGHSHDIEDQDEHERQHAREWQERFANRQVTTGQLILFGLTGGLMPCPSAFAVLLLCLQLKRFALGFALVLAFSIGLALTMVTVGSLAALSVKHATRRFTGLHKLAARMPYASAGVMILIGLVIAWQGAHALGYL